jgi:hypothetical protein
MSEEKDGLDLRVTHSYDVATKMHRFQGWLDGQAVGRCVTIPESELVRREVEPGQVADTLLVTLVKSAEATVQRELGETEEGDDEREGSEGQGGPGGSDRGNGESADGDGRVLYLHRREGPGCQE